MGSKSPRPHSLLVNQAGATRLGSDPSSTDFGGQGVGCVEESKSIRLKIYRNAHSEFFDCNLGSQPEVAKGSNCLFFSWANHPVLRVELKSSQFFILDSEALSGEVIEKNELFFVIKVTGL